MIKEELNKHFAYRLRESMISAGYDSPRSPSGVNIHKLQEITGYSLQICRKYLRGDALPEINKIAEIAQALQVSPGWLLFGEEYCKKSMSIDHITISAPLLNYIYTKANHLYFNEYRHEDIPGFLLSLTKDISEINASDDELKRIVDLALSSAKHFRVRHG